MSITKEDILRIGELSKLSISSTEIEMLTQQMKNIIKFADMISNLEHQDQQTCENISTQQNIFREDKAQESYNVDELLKNAPCIQSDYFSVPNVKRREASE